MEIVTTTDKIAPIHPGEVLMEDSIEVFGITADTALRLAKFFGTSAEFWINLQSHYELDRAEDLAGEQIAAITPLHVA